MVVVARAVTFTEENFHALRHVDTHEVVEPPDHGRDDGQRHGFRNAVFAQVPATEFRYLEVELHHEGAIETLPGRQFLSTFCA